MADQVFNVTIKGIGDFSDVVSNVNSVQKALTKLKIPDKLGNNLSQNISNFMREYDKYQQKVVGGIKTQGDNNAVNRNLSSMLSSYQKIVNDFNKLQPKDFKEIFKLDEGAFASFQNKIKDIQVELDKIKIDPDKIKGPIEEIQKLTKSTKIVGPDGLLQAFQKGLTEGGDGSGLVKAREALTELENHYARFQSQMTKKETRTGWEDSLDKMRTQLEAAEKQAGPLFTKLAQNEQELNKIGAQGMNAFKGVQQGLKGTQQGAESVVSSLKKMHQEEFGFNKQVQQIDRQIQSYFGLSQMIRKVGNIARDAFNTVKELDQAMTATAVVTRFNVSDMWDMLPTYTEQANKLGATIKDVYDAATLYYQQGLNTNQAMGLANETLKMARIAGMDAAEATDMMTSALRGFNMEINQASAQKVNDIYSQLAAVTASDTRELGTAMEKTASLANSANMDIETTSAFLAQMIETTREAPENLGTAMKTIIARFQEMKKDPTSLVDADGVAMDVNKVDTALKSIGVQLTNTKGEFRDLDDVFLDISKRWDSLSQGQQRYIATTAAGSRQQSRFIAMMSNYDRTMELVNEANNSAGASQKQFEKTMDSMSSKLNQLKNAWNEFTMGLMNNQILKAGVTGLTGFFTIVNKIIDVLGKIPPKPFEGITKSILTLGATLAGLNFAKKFTRGAIMAGAGWWTGEGTFGNNFKSGFSSGSTQRVLPNNDDLLKQQIANRLSSTAMATNGITIDAPVSVNAYLEKINASDLPDAVKTEINTLLQGKTTIDVQTQANINLVLEKSQRATGVGADYKLTNGMVDNINNLDKLNQKTGQFTAGLTRMGSVLQQVGSKLGPFGSLLSTIGSIMVTLGTTLGALKVGFMETYVATIASATGATTDAVAKNLLSKENIKAAITSNALGKALWSSLGPFAAIAAIIGVLIVAYKAWDAAVETNAERMERLTNSANTASDAYDSLKQSTSELKSSLEEIQSNEDSFEGLVAGTTEFNDKLTETNQKIDELIQKYPELNNYLSVDKNGLKHISQEGIDFIKKQQDQLVGNASAQNILQNARLKAEQDRQRAQQNEQEIKRIKGIYQNTMQPINGVDLDKSKTLTEEEEKRVKELEQESKYLKENADNAEKIATQQALAASFTNIEASDRERLASMYVDSYEAAKKRAETEKDESKMLQTYADYYGYKYDAISKKVLDSTGEEIEIDKNALKGVYSDIVATIDIQASAESLDKIESSVNQKFSKGLKLGVSNGENILSEVLSGDIESDPKIVKKLAEKTPQQIEETLKELTDAEMSTLMGMKEEDFAADRENLRKEFANSIKDHAQKTFEAQSQVYEDLGAKIAKTQGLNFGQITKQYQDSTKSISEEISKLSVEQANTLNNIASQLEENVGLDTTGTFLEKATSIYSKKDKGLTKEFDDILSGIKWDSASSRLVGYTKAINSSRKEIKEFGKDMKSSANEANILGEAFDEFVGGDWSEELRENIDDFQNSLGEIDGAGILKAAEQSNTLKNLLDSGAVSATGVAIALQGIEDGKYSVGEVDSAVLQLISSLNRLEDVSLEAHNIVSNFDPGIDTGEGEDFIKNNAKAVEEFMKNNEWGNDQLKNYIKLAAGEELWQKTLSKNKGDLKKTTKALDQYVTKFKDGFLPAYKDIISGKGINGKSLTENIDKAIKDKDISKKLGDKMKGITAEWDENGFLQWDFNGLTTKQLEKFFQEAYGVSEEYAKLFLQDIKNYNETEGAELAKNDLKATIRSKDFQEARGAYGDNGKLILTDEDVRIFKAAGGSLKDLAEAAGVSEKELKENQFKVYEKNGERRDKYDDLLRDYAETFKTGEHKIGSLFSAEDLLTNGKLDLNKLIADTRSKSFDEEQSMRAAYEAYLQGEKQGDRTLYEGMEIEHGLQTYEDFTAALEGMTESSQWVQVGETIGAQIVNALNASSFLESMRGGSEGAVITEGRDGPKLNKENLDTVISQIQASGESTKEAQKDITTYLGQSKELFDSLKSNPEKQKEILDSVANKLKKLEDFDPQKINKVFRDSFGQGYDLYGIQKKISNLGVSGQKAYDYYSKNGLGNTNLYTRQKLEWGEDPTKDKKNFKNAQSWGLNAEDLKNKTSTYLSSAMGFGEKGKEIQIAFTPMLQGEDGKPQVLSQKSVESYLGQIVNKSTDKSGKVDISKLMELDTKGLIMGAFEGEGATEAASALGELEHYLEEAREKGLNLQEVLDGIKFSPKLKGQELEKYIKKIDGLTGEQKEILLNTKITDKDKATQFIDTIEKEFGGKDKKKKEIILQATQKIADGDKEGGQKLLKDNGFSEDDVKKITQQVEILYSGKIVNKDQFKKSIDEQIDNLLKSGSSKSAKKDVKVTGKATIKQDKPKDTKAGVKYEKKGQDNPDDKEAGVKYKLKKQDLPKPKTADLTYNLVSQDSPKPQRVDISPNFTGTWEKTLKIKEAAHGKNNHIQHSSIPSFGSAARGRYGTIGPKDKGGLTLTGEKGFEIAWLPSENRSMILGAGGPQMINLPNDAVVYTHEQSKDIIKRKGIPAGSHSGRTNRDDTTTTSSSKSSKTSSGKSGGNTTKKKSTDDKKEKANTSAISKIIVWWDNITRRADATQRKADKNQKTYEKYLKDIKATLKDTGTIGGGNDFINNTNKAINLYNDQLKRAAAELTNLDIGTSAQRKAKGKKATKKANKQAFMDEQGGAVRISYTKGGKKKKTVNKTIATAGYIKEQDGTYIIDQAKLNKIKNKEERKALADALNKEINDRISKKNAAEDNIEKANEALEKFSEELYNTFFAWENELTKIWNITQKIEQAQSRMSRNDAYDELLKAQLSTGKLTAGAESRNKDLTNFRSRLETQNNLLKERQNAITESQKNVQRILTSEDEKQTLANVNNKLNANAKATQKLNELNNAKQAKQAYDTAIKNRDTTQKSIDKIQAKIIKLKDKKNLSNADKEEIKKLRKQRDELKKQKENYDKIIKDNKSLAGKVNQLQLEYNSVKGGALDATQKGAYEKYQKALTDQITAQEWGRKFANPQMRADGTIDIQFNTEAFETARTNGDFTSDMAKAIQDWVKELQEASSNLQQNYEELTREVTDYYTQLDTLQQEWADYGKELTEITETYEKEKIDKIKQLSDEIKKTLDKLLNDVKRNLDERRRQQENTKTEQDISQKQQRLAALRADTSGGHQVEIAQLEKEIAEAQQNYQNSLEDQLLDKLQQQADLAAEQRERQIELQEMLASSVSNIEKVNEWMIQAQEYSNLKEDEQNAFKEEVRAGYRSKNNYDQLTKAERDEVDTNFEEFFHGLVTNSEKQEKLNLAISGLEGTLKTLDDYLQKQNQPAASSSSTGGGNASGGSTGSGSASGGNKTTTAAAKEEARVAALRNYDKKLNDYASNGKLSGSELKKLIEAGNNSYVNKNGAAVFADLHKVGFSWDKILTAAKAAGYSKKDIKTWGSSDAFKKALKSYATGGLANFTGPAWLDGTPSKPELILNSTDTRNFIALRDVLSKVMSSNDSTENSYANTEFNINIHVDKVADDYDVDKIITKVKKEITKSAGYRNVTQVRSFR